MTLRTKWTPEQIRRARQTPLKPLLEQIGCPMQELKNGNWKIYGLPADIIVKETFWVCPDTGNGGNAIDLLVRVLGMTFNHAMEKLETFSRSHAS